MGSGLGMIRFPGGVRISLKSKWQVSLPSPSSGIPDADVHLGSLHSGPTSISVPSAHLQLLSKYATGCGLSNGR